MNKLTTMLGLWVSVWFTFACSAQSAAPTPQQCWSAFRQAVIAADHDTLTRMTRFPLAVHGVADSVPVQKVDRERFNEVLGKILAQPMARYEGETLITYTMRELLIKTTTIEKPANNTSGRFQVGELVFEYNQQGCQFTQAYLSE